MQIICKKYVLQALLLLSLSFSQAFSMEHTDSLGAHETANKRTLLNSAGLIGSAASFIFWTPATLKIIGQYGLAYATTTTFIPRLAIDATCIAASAYNTPDAITLNSIGLAGSVSSLALWAPAIIANQNDALYIARAAIDIAQIILCGSRLL